MSEQLNSNQNSLRNKLALAGGSAALALTGAGIELNDNSSDVSKVGAAAFVAGLVGSYVFIKQAIKETGLHLQNVAAEEIAKQETLDNRGDL